MVVHIKGVTELGQSHQVDVLKILESYNQVASSPRFEEKSSKSCAGCFYKPASHSAVENGLEKRQRVSKKGFPNQI